MRNPAKFVRKDARTAIYRVLYGRQEHTIERRHYRRPNIPAQDEARQLSTFFHWEDAKECWDTLHRHAAFVVDNKAALEARLEQLKNYKPRD
jgi:hypothetical protein